MKKLMILLLGLTLIMGETIGQDSFDELITIPLSSPGRAGKLEVGLVNGSIAVQAGSSGQVIVQAKAREKAERSRKRNDDGRNANMKRIGQSTIELEAEERGNNVSINTNSWQQSLDLQIQVPPNFDLELSTVNHGNIEVTGVAGNISVSNVNGKITLNKVSGSAILNTVNGDIIAIFNTVSPGVPMSFTTLNGDVDISLPANVNARLKMKSDQGDIFTDFDMKVEKTPPKVDQRKDGDVYRVVVEDWIVGTINNGGPEFLMKNMNGSIYIRKN